MTHEAFIAEVRRLAADRVSEPDKGRLMAAKLVYGAGSAGVRGTTYFDCWHSNGADTGKAEAGALKPEAAKLDVIEVAAMAEESPLQLAGTTLHELGHSLAGWAAGHRADWREACAALGLMKCDASGQAYQVEDFDADLWAEIAALSPSDGSPIFGKAGTLSPGAAVTAKPRPCTLGYGTKGGKSRGKGSGSRMLLYICACGCRVRAARGSGFDATCNKCKAEFSLASRLPVGA